MKFELNPIEIQRYDAWKKSLPKKLRKDIKIIFSISSGIGIGVDVECGKYKKDITDYGSW